MRSSLLLLSVALTLGVALFIFRPKNIEGPRAPAIPITGSGFPYTELNAALRVAFPQDHRGRSPRYDALRAHPESLDRYLGLISEIGPRSAPHRFTRREQRLSYMLNAYTAGLLAVIRDACPIKSVEDPLLFNGLFWRVSLRVGGELLSLNDMAAEISSLAFDDSRVMLAVSRGMRANVPLRDQAWTPQNLEEGLAALESILLTPPYTERSGDTLTLGAPYRWYEHRFLPNPRRYVEARSPSLTEGIKRREFANIDTRLDGLCTSP